MEEEADELKSMKAKAVSVMNPTCQNKRSALRLRVSLIRYAHANSLYSTVELIL
jgi:hypothetical protein